MRHLMSPLDLSVEELEHLLDLANDIEQNPEKYAHSCDGKKIATLFYEPSTRTRLSFEAAMMNLGGKALGFSSADSSSASKGESVSDTIRVVSCFADICAMRHPKEGAPLVASLASKIPVINAGDGGHQHPTQTLTDLLTIRSLKGRLDNITIGLCGDLKFGRTVHSLIEALVRYPNVKFVLISPEELRIPDYIREADTPEAMKKSGYAFGNFQYLLSDFPAEKLHETIPDFHNTVDRYAKFEQAVQKDVMGRVKEVEAEISFIKEREKDCHYFGDLLAAGEIPLRVTHNDTKLNNVLFDKASGNAICVIDLDTVMPGFAAHDFGDAIRFGASTAAEDEKDLNKVSCDMTLFEAYFNGFMEGCRGSLTDKEVEALPMGAKIMTFECGMRFLTDYLQGDTYFKIHYPEQNLDRTRTQLKLVKDMEEKWDIMARIVRN